MIRAAGILLGTAVAARVDEIFFALLFALAPFGPGTCLTGAFMRGGLRTGVLLRVGFETAGFSFVHALS